MKTTDTETLAVTTVQKSNQELLQELVRTGEIRGSFAKSISECRRPSVKQQEWIDKLVTEYFAGQTAKPVIKTVATVQMNGIVELFGLAGQKLKSPSIKLRLEDATQIRLKLAGKQSKFAGTIFIDRGEFGTTIARISPAGDLTINNNQDYPELVEMLKAFAADPAAVAAAYGKLTKHCCFCSAELTDDRSIETGYGPVCAKKWSLPWGN